MSGCVWRRSKGDSNGDNVDGDEEEAKGGEIIAAEGEKEQKKRKGNRVFGGYRNGGREGKKASLFPFRKLRKLFRRSPSSSSSASSSSLSRTDTTLFSGKRFVGGLCCCVCLSKPQVLENNPSQGSVDPDDPEKFTYEYLKSMIEKNDFYSKECNTHVGD